MSMRLNIQQQQINTEMVNSDRPEMIIPKEQ